MEFILIFSLHAEDAASPVLPPACLEWHLDTLLAGGKPINRTNHSLDEVNVIQNDLSCWRKENQRHGKLRIILESSGTSRDCLIPGGLDPHRYFLRALGTEDVLIKAYCGENRRRGDFSTDDNLPITLVPTGHLGTGQTLKNIKINRGGDHRKLPGQHVCCYELKKLQAYLSRSSSS
ncbi:unnamed protein product [Eruca vesicaria subsp. sativa]|uniref:Uncharacterized protein n=1 Tax=Eruca vesicaria subsp. sativa TaxID=29727 RepID=A0ABC8KAC7_ERUVS|nr:unnamed protein product [Eruca vesicaria subsp. sativa]